MSVYIFLNPQSYIGGQLFAVLAVVSTLWETIRQARRLGNVGLHQQLMEGALG